MFREHSKFIMATIFVVFSCSLFAAEMTYQEKKAEINRLALEYKAKTGFEGQFQYDLDTMTFTSIEGHFKNIRFNTKTPADSLRAFSDEILKGIQPYLGVPLEQIITYRRDRSYGNEIFYKYRQEISGIGFDDFKELDIVFAPDSANTVSVINMLAIVDDQISNITVSKQQAIDIMIPIEKENNHKFHNEAMAKREPPEACLKYCRLDDSEKPKYRLCWIAYWQTYDVIIDATSGKVLRHGYCAIEDTAIPAQKPKEK